MDVVGELLVLGGAVLVLIGGIGAVRLPDVYSRMHAASKVSTLGLILVVLGAELLVPFGPTSAGLALAAIVQLLTVPVGSHLIGRAAHRRDDVPLADQAIDELADDLGYGDDAPRSE